MSEIDRLVAGYRRFRSEGWTQQRARWAELAEGQSPRVMVIACSDSRVDPTLIFDVTPGEIFVVRNVANLVPPFETSPGHHGVSAALEFAVNQLEVSEIVVLGHGACGGVKAALEHAFDGAEPGDGGFIADWVSLLDEVRDRVVDEHGTGQHAIDALEHECVRVSLANLRTFPNIAKREQAGTLTLTGAYFTIASGVLYILDEPNGRFVAAS